jgi:hypothetical protein
MIPTTGKKGTNMTRVSTKKPEKSVEPAEVLRTIPYQSVMFLADVPVERMDLTGMNPEHECHLRYLRKKGVFALTGPSHAFAIPLKLSPLGDEVRRLAAEQVKAKRERAFLGRRVTDLSAFVAEIRQRDQSLAKEENDVLVRLQAVLAEAQDAFPFTSIQTGEKTDA